jgi:putative PEP-CTERM system histidine kinase
LTVLAATSFLSALIYGQLVVIAVAYWRGHGSGLPLITALAATGLWALAMAIESLGTGLGAGTGVLEVVRSGSWVVFLGWLYRSETSAEDRRGIARRVVVPVAAFGLLLVALDPRSGLPGAARSHGLVATASICGHLVLAVGGLVLLEALLRQASPEWRERMKYLGIGVGALLTYDFFLYSEALLFGRVDPTLATARGALNVVAAPLIAVAATRPGSSSLGVRRPSLLVHHPAALTSVGIYMVGLAGTRALLRASEYEWERAFQVTFLFAAMLMLALVLFSSTMREFLRWQLTRILLIRASGHREELSRFMRTLSSNKRGMSLPSRALRAIASVTRKENGALWLREDGAFCLVARLGFVAAPAEERAEGALIQGLTARGGRLLECAATGTRPDWVPEWLHGTEDPWLLIPLVQRDSLIGFVFLSQPGEPRPLGAESRKLLVTCAEHAATFLGEERSARTLQETQGLRTLSERVSFAAHDLRNMAEGLSLTLANARKHIQNPSFQRDLLATMEESVAGMHRLLDKVGERPNSGNAQSSTNLAELILRSAGSYRGKKPSVVVHLEEEAAPVNADPDCLSAIMGHLIRNAVEAVGRDGRVDVRLRRDGERVAFEVSDDGPGMTREFVRQHLAHPFLSETGNGFGIGLYECCQLAKDVGGQLEIDSEPGRGTVARLQLPLAVGSSSGAAVERRRLHG